MGIRRGLGSVLVAAVAASVAVAVPVAAQSTAVSVEGFDRSGLEVVVLASFDAGGTGRLWSAPGSPWGARGSLVAGEVELEAGSDVVRVMVPERDGSLLRLNDGGPLNLRRFFGADGAGADLSVWIRTTAGTAVFAAAGVASAGGNYANIEVPESERAVVAGITGGERFVLALTRPAPQPAPGTGLGSVVLEGTARLVLLPHGSAVGFSDWSDRGEFEARSWDGVMVSGPGDLPVLAQVPGLRESGTGAGLVDLVVIQTRFVEGLGSGFVLRIDDRSLFSAAAVHPDGQAPHRVYRNWMWDSPCVALQPDTTAEVSLVALHAGADVAGAMADTALSALEFDRAELDAAFDPAVVTYAATAESGAQTVTMHATGPQWGCGTRVSPADADPGADGHQVRVDDDGTVVTVTSVAADGSTRAYTVTLTVAAPAGTGVGPSQDGSSPTDADEDAADEDPADEDPADEDPVVVFDGAPEVDALLTASLRPGGLSPSWVWARSERPDTGFTVIDGANSATYTPTRADHAHFLRATASYTEAGNSETVSDVTEWPVGVQPTILVKNTGTRGGLAAYFPGAMNQRIRSGDNPAGYLLDNVVMHDLVFDRYPGIYYEGAQMWVKAGDSDVPGTTALFALDLAEHLPGPARRFAAPPATVLDAETPYYFQHPKLGSVGYAYRSGFDPGAASGWQLNEFVIKDDGRFSMPGYLWIEISGLELLGPPGAPLAVSASGDAGAVTVSWSAPGSTGQRDVTKYQVRYKKTAEAASEYSVWADVADGDGDGDLADERSVPSSGRDGGSEYTLQVRAVNSQDAGTTAEVVATP